MNKKEQDMSSKSDNSEVQSSKIATQDASDVRFSRRNMLLASSAAVAAPALGTALTVDIARAQQGRFEYSSDREAKSAARALALESLLIEKGIITNNTVDNVLSFFETQMGPFNGA